MLPVWSRRTNSQFIALSIRIRRKAEIRRFNALVESLISVLRDSSVQ